VIAREIESRAIRIVETETDVPSPFARSMLFGYVAAFMYEGDSPLAERRAAALSLDPTLLAELLGRAELRELLDPGVIEQTELELQRLTADRKAKDAEGVVDLLRMLGPLSLAEIVERTDLDRLDHRERSVVEPVETWLSQLAKANRVIGANIAGEPRWAVAEDAARLRDALGTPIPMGVPVVFLEPVADPLGDLVARFARTHGPFTTANVAERFGLGQAVVLGSLRKLVGERRIVEGEFRPGATGSEWCDVEVLRRLRARSLAALRHEVEPVDAATFGRFLPVWQNVGSGLRGVDGVAQVVDQLAGVALPASAWESLVLPARVRDYSPVMLDELMLTGEVLWAGGGDLPGNDGWVSLHLADSASVTLPGPSEIQERTDLETAVLEALAGGGAFFFRQLAQAVGSVDDKSLHDALWELVWAGLATNDTLAPLRAYLGGPVAKRTRAPRVRAYRGRVSMPSMSGPPSAGGRWSLVPLGETENTVRAKALAEQLLERHGVVTRGAVQSEGVRGGFSLVYRVLSGFEETGRARRGYFINGLGAAQFATGATIDRLRGFVQDGLATREEPSVVTLAATDPANPYGAALPWPALEGGHRPGRKAGAIVVLVNGELSLYLERGGRTALVFTDDATALELAARDLARVVISSLGKLRVDRANGEFIIGSPLGVALVAAGFQINPQGLRLRA
jgi:ATP-dependent Lhr-like helicase